jgi:succinyl-CoA synthetase beta subunit
LKWPIIVRLDGTNSKEGLEILKKNSKNITISSSMDEAAKLAVKGASNVNFYR